MRYLHYASVFQNFFLSFICMMFLFQTNTFFGQDSSTETNLAALKLNAQESDRTILKEKNALALDKSLSVFLILDSIRKPNQQTLAIFDDSPNYFQMENNEAIITGRHRGKSFFHQGHVEGLEQSTDSAGNLNLRFYMIGSQFSNGKIASYEITLYTDGSALVHQFVKLDNRVDVYYIAHKASASEIQAIKDYWKGN